MRVCSLNWVLILCVFFFPWLFQLNVFASPAEPIVIGGTVSLAGKYREPSLMIQKAFQLWEREVNAQGGMLGRPVKLVLYNDRSEPERVRHSYEKLITQDHVDLVLSPYGTPLTLVASEVSERHEKVMLACAASGEAVWERQYKYVFGMYALGTRYFIGLVDLMARNGVDSVAIVYEASPFHSDVAKGTRSWARRFGVNIGLSRSFDVGREDLPGLLDDVIKVNADNVILSAYPPDCYHFLKLLEEKGFRPKILGMTIAPVHPEFVKRAGAMAEGVFGPSQWEADERIPFPGTKRFIKEFTAYADKRPSYHAGSAYAACQILKKAIGQTGSLDQNKIRDYILALDTVTVIGRFKVDHTGRQIGHNPILIQWQDGNKEIVYPKKMQTAKPRF